MSYNGTRPHAWFKEPVRNTERGREMDLLGSIVVVTVGGVDWYMCWAKGHRVFSAIHLKSNCAAQAGAVKLHLGVEWILCLKKKRQPTRAPCVAVRGKLE